MLDKFLIHHKDDIWNLRALYLKGENHLALSELEEAVEIFSNLLPRYPQLKDYTQLKLAEMYLTLKEEEKAFEQLSNLLQEFPNSRLIPNGIFLLGKLFFNRGDLNHALKIFGDYTRKYSKKDMAPESMFFMGTILEKQSKTIQAYETYAKIFHSFPLDEFAIKAEGKIEEIKRRKIKLPEFSQELVSKRIKLLMKGGKYSTVIVECNKYLKKYTQGPMFLELTFNLAGVYLSMKKRDEALEIFQSFFKKYPSSSHAPEALYGIANIFWNQGKITKAIEYCYKTSNQYPFSRYAEKSYFILSRIFEQKKQHEKAISILELMLKKFPQGDYAPNGYWRIGWTNYLLGDYQKAAEIFSKAASRFPDSSNRDMLLYWAGKSNEKNGKIETAHSYYQKGAKEYPYNYYGHRARTRLNKKSGNTLKIIDPSLQRNMENEFINAAEKPQLNPKDSFHYEKTKELMALGLYESVLEEVRMIAKHVSINTPEKILWIGNLYVQAGGYHRALSLMEGFLKELPKKRAKTLSSEYWKLFFPLAYREVVAKNASSYKIDPFFIEGLIRQESAFNADSLSRAGARGLMQLMPATGKHEFQKKYKGEFQVDKLFHPKINITLGSQHLANLFNKTDNNPILVLSGYNAGLSRAIKWKNTLKTSDPDVFIEMVPFRETRGYIKKVLRNYFNYILLYGNGEEQDKILALNEKDL